MPMLVITYAFHVQVAAKCFFGISFVSSDFSQLLIYLYGYTPLFIYLFIYLFYLTLVHKIVESNSTNKYQQNQVKK